MNTIVINEKDMDTKKYDGCSSAFMFDDFNLVIHSTRSEVPVKIEVRTIKNEGIVIRVNNTFFYGVRFDMTYDQAFPEPGMWTICEYENGDIGIGQLYVPLEMNEGRNVEKILEILITEAYLAYEGLMQMVFSYMVCIMMMGEERRRELRKTVSAKAINGNQAKEKKSETENNKVFFLNDIVEYVANNYDEQKHHKMKCLCWEVRGHYRHYKSGKVVFIPAFKKGKQRDKMDSKSKEYYV
jgi:hypothetical protein